MPEPLPWSFAAHPRPALRLTCQLTDKIHGLASLLTVRNTSTTPTSRNMPSSAACSFAIPFRRRSLDRVDGERRVDIETRRPDAGVHLRTQGQSRQDHHRYVASGGNSREQALRVQGAVPELRARQLRIRRLANGLSQGKGRSSCEGGRRCDNKVTQLLEGFSAPRTHSRDAHPYAGRHQ